MQYLSGAGQKAAPVVPLTWGLLLISVVVILIVAGLLAGAIWRRPSAPALPDNAALLPDRGGLAWLWVGVGISTLVLLFSIVWTVAVLARIEAPSRPPGLTIEITGWQWWWQARYLSPDPSRVFTTADEIHIPVGQPVRLRLIGGDVIHSFWVPQLGGKMDAIPGQTNETWIEASTPGRWRGQCTEYCGLQHAHMGLVVVADPPARFGAWWNRQLQPPAPQLAASDGATAFVSHCGGCHAVRGTDAQGSLGPDLSHLAGRATLASATLPNDRATLSRWIADPQHFKPGALMPAPSIDGRQLSAITAYLTRLD